MITIITSIVVIIAIFFFIFPIGIITGNSMHPTFKHGEYVLMSKIYKLKENDVYYFKREEVDVIKRLNDIQHVEGSKGQWLHFLGDNPECSFDSRHYGYIHSNQVKAKILFKIGGKK